MIIIIDNYDSFTYNLVQYVGHVNKKLKVFKNNDYTIEEIVALNPKHIIISPGPGRPEDSGVSIDVIKFFGVDIPILGICLGHQAISIAFGGKVVHSDEVMHGKVSKIIHNNDCLFDSVPKKFSATRYHSLMVEHNSLPKELLIIAETENKIIMGIKHVEYNIYGLQFHPESIMTNYGKKIINNFLKL